MGSKQKPSTWNLVWGYIFLKWPRWRNMVDFWRNSSRWGGWAWKYLFFGWLFTDYEVTFIPINKELEEPESVVVPKQIVADLIRRSSHRIILPSCICRIGYECKDHDHGIGCIFMGEATLQTDPRLAKQATVEKALAHLERAIDNGLIPQIGKVDPDAFWIGVNMKDWDRFLTLCFCCPCCCIAMRKHPTWSAFVKNKMHKMEGLSITVNENLCNGCTKCVRKCFTNAIKVDNGSAAINPDLCKGCGICADHCPQKAISIRVSDGDKMLDTMYRRVKSYGNILLSESKNFD
jgi:UDP-glucose 4-epimerase